MTPAARSAAVLVAGALDLALAEPPPALHPVVAVGRYLERVGSAVPSSPPRRATLVGGAAWTVGALLAAGAGAAVARAPRRLPAPLSGSLLGLALWPLLSARLLLEEVAAVERALGNGSPAALEDGRRTLARIVSRDTSTLGADEVRAAALESLAENLSDSLVAPLWWFAVAGLPGAALYRYANTADAMWGYRTARWEHAGKVAARADDVLNAGPARLTGLLLAGPRPAVLRRLRREARRTPSPNAGWPMGALALRLDVALAKPGVYVLHGSGAAPGPDDVRAAISTARRCALVAVATAAVLSALRDAAVRRTTS